ncbi:MAG: regulator of sigma D [Lentisphaeria bacterium]|jgi:regulator of sigma D
MLENCKSAQERWGGVSEIIDRWLKSRQELLVQYCSLSEIVETSDHEEYGPSLQKLCQIMVDYISAGHFEVYDQLVKEGRDFNNTAGLESAGDFFKTIDSCTEYLLDFNDKYLETDDLGTIVADLSSLGEVLERRFEVEDSMIELLHTVNKDRATI